MTKLFALALVSITILLGGCSIVGKTPEPAWKSVRQDGNIEIRRYDPMILAEVTTTGERYDAINDGFRILADYIFGNNEAKQDIAMTAPVTQQSSSSSVSIPMTVPVTQQKSSEEQSWKVSFVMPGNYTMDTLPKPRTDKIRFIEIPEHNQVVIRFSGMNTDKNLAEHQGKLMNWVKAQSLKTSGEPVYAFYNPPWTPFFLKRNEIMLRLE
jgi:hypothetical protein